MGTYERDADGNGEIPEEIAQIQRALGVTADGNFGQATDKAVKAWQRANGQKPDGLVGPDMLLALGLLDLLVVENGDEGALVRRLQSAVGVEVDGEFGDATEDALRAYLKKNKLKANGVADAKTLKAMGLLGVDAKKSAPTLPTSVPSTGKTASKPNSAAPAPAPKQAERPQVGRATPSSQGTHGAKINTWAYQLADIDPKDIAALDVDLVVVDYAADGSDETAFKSRDVALMQSRPDGGRKLVVSYMSIGEAEDYRYYWNAAWKKPKTRPAWLDDENPDWEGNYKVRYWDAEWQRVIMGAPNAYLDRIIAAGFDGVYLDIIDAFEYWRDEKGERPDADKDMIAFVSALAAYARAKRPNFWIIPQNGEALLEDPAYRAVISAIGKEDVFYGQDGDGKANPKSVVAECLDCLAYARKDDIPVLVIEYLDDAKKIDDARRKLADLGCPAYFGPRALDEVRDDPVKA